MKLRNKKTGEILDYNPNLERWNGPSKEIKHYTSLAELNEEWEDYEEPEIIYYLSWDGVVLHSADKTGWQDAKLIGNYFETEEEAEKAVEKLKAWKRLRDKGFRFEGWEVNGTIRFETEKDDQEWSPKYRDDLDLLFGGEE